MRHDGDGDDDDEEDADISKGNADTKEAKKTRKNLREARIWQKMTMIVRRWRELPLMTWLMNWLHIDLAQPGTQVRDMGRIASYFLLTVQCMAMLLTLIKINM
eukprot:TRINITY_DN19271_c0_g1_i1.p2 TRINITY_DN19271_c0_g1~~TRINITY_DN19271_c0_g1_i1.p2  ORF type:complete len:103 (+),score=17.79 TRINITY_DN19271_c0_g1_i1:321-629(+)